MGNKLVFKLLSRQVNAWQMAGFLLANLCGMTIILSAIQFSSDVMPLFTNGDSFMRPGQLVVNKRVSALRTIYGTSPVFSEDEIKDISGQPFVESVGLFTPSQFSVFATIGSPAIGMEFSTQMFFESIPDSFIDVDLRQWQYRAGSDTVPIILPQNYLNLYNFGFAGSQGLPVISESIIKSIDIRLRLTGTQKSRTMSGRVVAFSKRLNTILVPQSFMDEANRYLSPGRTAQPSRLTVTVANSADERMAEYLQAKNYDTEGGGTDAAKTAGFLRLMTTIVVGVGLIICALAFYVLLLSIFLLLQKHTERIDTLLLTGHSPGAVARPFHILAIGLNTIVLLVSLWLMTIVRDYYLPRFGELYPRFESAGILMSLFTGISLFVFVSVLNYLAIRRKVLSIWHIHE